MKKLRLLIIQFLLLFFTSILADAQVYPEFTGNYYQCGNDWCEIQHHELNTMQLLIGNRQGRQTVGYGGFFEIPDTAANIDAKKPRFLFYMGRSDVDPRYTAMVELEPMPYNNAPVAMIDGKDYNLKAKYSAKLTKQLWTFKREIPIRFKPIEGKTGMFIIEPAAPLNDGFYAIDYGVPEKTGHSGLRTAPEAMGFYKTMNVQTAIPFIIGDRTKMAGQPAEASAKADSKPDITIDVGGAVGGLMKGLFH